MRPSAAIGWQFQRRHRWGLAALCGYFAAMAAGKLAVVGFGWHVTLDSSQSFAAVVIVPMTSTFIYGLAVFSFGLDGDLATRASMYPRRLFTLPLSNSALAGWPMLYGSAAMVMLWTATRLCTVWPHGAHVPVIWPALLAASLLAWTQALTWMPYPVAGARVIVTVLWLATIDAIVLVALHFEARESVMLALLAPHVPLAFVVARYAVARGRCGDVAGWRDGKGRETHLGYGIHEGGASAGWFVSASHAQAWFEWRQHGRSLPILVALLLPFELSLLFVFRDTPVLVLETLLIVGVTPPFMAAFVAATSSRVSSFDASRPLSTASQVAALLRTTVRSTVTAWLLVAVTVPSALLLSGTWPLVKDRMHDLRYVFGSVRSVALAVYLVAMAMLWTWRRLVQALYVSLSGREWLIKGHVFVTLASLTAAGPLVVWIARNGTVRGELFDAFPSVLLAAVAMKMSAAGWAARRLARQRLLESRMLVTIALTWSAAVLAIDGLFVWFVDAPFVPKHVLMSIAILTVPLARLLAAPLALAWNRHR